MQKQMSVITVLPLLSRVVGAYTSDPCPKGEMPRVAFQLDFTSAATDGTTASIQPQGSLDGTSWRNIGSVTSITTSATVKGAIVDVTTASPLTRVVVTTGVNTASFSILAVGGM